MQEQICQFLQLHWAGVSAFMALCFFSFVNALPENKKDFDFYQVTYHFLRGLTPVSRLQSPPAKLVEAKVS